MPWRLYNWQTTVSLFALLCGALKGEALSKTWAVVGSAMGHSSSPARAGMARKIPLVKMRLFP